jgi:hypothetical protein
MTATVGQIENLVMRIQHDSLDDSTLGLTLSTAQRRRGVDETTCAAVIGALVDAGVLRIRRGLPQALSTTCRTASRLTKGTPVAASIAGACPQEVRCSRFGESSVRGMP